MPGIDDEVCDNWRNMRENSFSNEKTVFGNLLVVYVNMWFMGARKQHNNHLI